MLNLKSSQNTDLETQLRKSQNRETIAQRKLENLKSRFERLNEEHSELHSELKASRAESLRIREQLIAARVEKEHLAQESAMWRSQLFERMEMQDKTKAELESVRRELKDTQERLARAVETHQTNHEELKRRDREKQNYRAQLDSLKAAHQESKEQEEELLTALFDAEQAIRSLQRSNDFHQREIAGLRTIGAGLTENLGRVAQQCDYFKERWESTQAELHTEKVESEQLLAEIEQLKNELFDAHSRLTTFQLEAEMRELRRVGTEKSVRATEEKFAELPAKECVTPDGGTSGSFLRRASKKVSGWFRFDDQHISSN